jgi:hypothetical protein
MQLLRYGQFHSFLVVESIAHTRRGIKTNHFSFMQVIGRMFPPAISCSATAEHTTVLRYQMNEGLPAKIEVDSLCIPIQEFEAYVLAVINCWGEKGRGCLALTGRKCHESRWTLSENIIDLLEIMNVGNMEDGWLQ